MSGQTFNMDDAVHVEPEITQRGLVPKVQIIDGELTADSRDVAAFFGKTHFHVLRDIRNLHCSDDFRAINFDLVKNGAGTTSHVMMRRDGFTFLVLGFDGEDAGAFRESYIAEFNRMDQALPNQTPRCGFSAKQFCFVKTGPVPLRS
ncbi:Rha family transcriptional regulator [Methylobacterium oxalidis]|uniref:Rha family transcriptional regulator n=1 Tax=Methylobacterium oxalidis TaxID=944322 RepID=A0A512J159_9HYPH|nr:Rha family transcriptional regulator [Methylobacterium oxalidis]GEP03702.1 hypothetical protein MOX02_17400 [Methylobacterium oxalidis]GJE33692.1 hypothetical protein LDDCCGHA_3895 [Methylobacterium oxalidis]GLS62286.1 hypothetical protein GCM10007888_06670 [Methylobacterium oxalidis]